MRRATLGVLFLVAVGCDGFGQTVVRGPYLQQATPNDIIIRWRTDLPTDSVVEWDLASSTVLQNTVSVSGSRTEHEVPLGGLSPETAYRYTVGSSGGPLATATDQVFRTPPIAGARRRTRVWVLGDSGTANADAARVRDAYRTWLGDRKTDVWLMLGDNAYLFGTDAEYEAAVFDMYPEELRQLALWPTLGNHDVLSTTTTPAETGPYYDIFTLPTAGEAGGEPSGSEGYYSFDHANVHFVCLNSAQGDSAYFATMVSWLQADLMATTQEWTVAFWHHPPYSKGSHDSDTESTLIAMRTQVLPVLESLGVDLVLCGHSHSFERSMLIDGHYLDSTTFDPQTMARDTGDGRFEGNGAYRKPSHGSAANEGAVYVVAGSSGLIQEGAFDHPVMIQNHQRHGSCVLEFWGTQADVLFLDSDGAVCDRFTVTKGGATPVVADHGSLVGPTCGARSLDEGSLWRVHDLGLDLGTAWQAASFNSGPWSYVRAPAGYGEPAVVGIVSFGGNPLSVHPTTYFRQRFTLGPDPSDVSGMKLLIDYDDAFVAYLNGVEVARSANLPVGPISYGTLATQEHESGALEVFDLGAFTGLLAEGNNVLAIEVHQDAPDSDDLFLDARLWTFTSEQVWSYEDSGTDLGSTWRDPGFNAVGWGSGPSPLGFGEDYVVTQVSSGGPGMAPSTTYFRNEFDFAIDHAILERMRLHIQYDDGFVAHLNGVEIARGNMPAGPVLHGTPSAVPVEPALTEVIDVSAHAPLLMPAGNVLAIEIHQWNAVSSDLVLDARLEYDTSPRPFLSDCAQGAVVDAQGELESVLFVGGSDGGLGRSVDLNANTSFEVRMEAPSLSTAPHDYVLGLWLGTPGPAQQLPWLFGPGTLCFVGFPPLGAHLASTIPALPGLVPATPLPLVVPVPGGLPGSTQVTLQALITVSPGQYHTTNAVRIQTLP